MKNDNILKEIREERKLTQQQLATGVGTCKKTIARIENKEQLCNLYTAMRLAKYLDLTVEEIFRMDDM